MTCKYKKCVTVLNDDAIFCHICGKRQQPDPDAKQNTKQRGNGQGSVYFDGKGYVAVVTKYYYTDDNGKRKPKRVKKSGFKTKREAVNHLPLLSGKKDKSVSTLNDYWRIYETASLPKISKGKQDNYYHAKKRLEELFFVPINTLTIEDLQSVINKKTDSHYPARDMKTVLSHLYKRAIAQQDVSINLSNYIELPATEEAEQIPFSKAEQKALWKLYSENDDFVHFILLMIYTGMMPGELLKMYKGWIDLQNQRIIGGGIKTKKRKETPIILPDIIIPVLEKIMKLSSTDKLVNVSAKTFYKKYYECLERAAYKDEKGDMITCRPLRPYSCRHTTGTALGTSEIPVAVMQKIMRHSKITTTQRYIHVDTDIMLNAVNKVQTK